jgi:hypothetical protein
VFLAPLWDGSLAFASTADILAKALSRTEIAWFGAYPQPFESLSEGEYLQIMGGEIVTESKVGWKHGYVNRGNTYYAQTTGGKSHVDNVTHIGSAKVGSTNSDEKKGFGKIEGSEDKSKELVVTDFSDDYDPNEPSMESYAGSSLERDRSIVSMVFSSNEDHGSDLTPEEYENWRRTGNIFGTPDPDDPDDDDDDENTVTVTDSDTEISEFIAANSMYYTMGHDGDYMTYTSAEALIAALKWNAGLSSENLLVGPEGGNLRWINQFADIGAMANTGEQEFSWVKSDEEFAVFEFLFPSWVRDGIEKLRHLVGA